MKHEVKVLDGLPMCKMAVVSYCQYGFDYQKNTDIWTNDRDWIDQAKRCPGVSCPKVVDGHHLVGVRAQGIF